MEELVQICDETPGYRGACEVDGVAGAVGSDAEFVHFSILILNVIESTEIERLFKGGSRNYKPTASKKGDDLI